MRELVAIVTADPRLLDDLLRVAAAAGARAEVAGTAEEARAAWGRTAVVLVGADLAPALTRVRPPRRGGVILVSADDSTGEDPYRCAVEIGAQDVAVLPAAEPWLAEQLAMAAEPQAADASMVSVVGGRGGAGASVLAAVLALTGIDRGLRTLLIDGDPLGGGLDLVLGQEQATGARWPDLAERRGRLGTTALRGVLPHLGDLAFLSWDRGEITQPKAEAMHAICGTAARGFDLVVADLPRQVTDAVGEALAASGLVLLVVPAEVRATAAAVRVAGALRRYVTDVRVVVRLPSPGGLSPESVAEALCIPLAGVLPDDRRLARAVERGELDGIRRGSTAEFCTRLLDTVRISAGDHPREREAA